MKLSKNLLIPAFVLLFAPAAYAAESAPQPSKTAKDLQCLVGLWKGTGSVHLPDGSSMSMQGSIECKSAAGGFGVACHARFTAPGAPAMEEDDLFGYSADDGLMHWFTVTNSGETHDHKGGIKDGVFVGEYQAAQGGQIFREQITLAFEGEKKIRFRSSSSIGGKDAGTFEGTMTK